MAPNRETLLRDIAELRSLCALPESPGVFERIDALVRGIQQNAGVPSVAAEALDVRFRAEDVYARPHLMPVQILRQILNERLHRLEAMARASMADIPLIPSERRSDGRGGRRASDRRLAAGSPTES